MRDFLGDGFAVFLACALAFVLLFGGFSMGRASVKDDCDSYGKARLDKLIYVCAKVGS